MGVVSRSAKPGGGTDINSGQTAVPADVNTDMNTLFTLVNGNLDADNLAANAVGTSEIASGAVTNDKVSGSAAIAVSKLDQTAGQLDADIVQAYADTDAEFNTRTDPLDSVATPSVPTNLEEELERIRFVLARYGIGIPTKITDGTNNAAWYDGLAVGPNLLKNGSFIEKTALTAVGANVPFGWTSTGATSPTLAWNALPVTEGYGASFGMVDATGATTDGIAQTLNGLRANTLYLVTARVLPTTANIVLTTTGATGTLGNLNLTTGAAGDGHVASDADWQTLAGLIETDAVPAPIVVKLNPDAAAYAMDFGSVSVREVIGSRDAEGTGREHPAWRGGNLVFRKISVNSVDATVKSDTKTEFFVPGDNYMVTVVATWQLDNAGGTMSIEENSDVDGVGAYAPVNAQSPPSSFGGLYSVMTWVNRSLTPGKTYGYQLEVTAPSVGNDHELLVTLERMH